jgi:hypothetical protein
LPTRRRRRPITPPVDHKLLRLGFRRRTITEPDAEPAGQVLKFRIKPDPRKSLYVTVRVFRSLTAMWNHCRRTGSTGRDFSGIARERYRRRYDETGYLYTVPECGEMCFSQTRMTVEIVAHECAHMGLGYIRRTMKHADFSDRTGHHSATDQYRPEERFCLVVGWMAAQIAARWQAWQNRQQHGR